MDMSTTVPRGCACAARSWPRPARSPVIRLVLGRDRAQAGAGALVLPSLFEEQIERESFGDAAALDLGTNSFADPSATSPQLDDYDVGPDRHLGSGRVGAAEERRRFP